MLVRGGGGWLRGCGTAMPSAGGGKGPRAPPLSGRTQRRTGGCRGGRWRARRGTPAGGGKTSPPRTPAAAPTLLAGCCWAGGGTNRPTIERSSACALGANGPTAIDPPIHSSFIHFLQLICAALSTSANDDGIHSLGWTQNGGCDFEGRGLTFVVSCKGQTHGVSKYRPLTLLAAALTTCRYTPPSRRFVGFHRLINRLPSPSVSFASIAPVSDHLYLVIAGRPSFVYAAHDENCLRTKV